ncbi:lateral flagellar peptidoglycan hydrolase (FlgJ-like) [Escherichia coli]|uniref:Lateral flagellar peptidoglycan hydrolase (FlgJ-like) n=1 Tax=Escherichia coli TaxID=562 RepID=A0A376L1Q4_ECOLX|nr:lateral flagellar peptidoglycan hydrolase (FlgJ-like) [Escherichia coli]
MKLNASGGIDGSDALMGPKVQANDIKQAAEQFEAIFFTQHAERDAENQRVV